MHHRQFTSQIDQERIVSAIQQAEKKSTGEIRVFVSSHQVDDALASAQLQFHRLGMTKTKYRNAILIFVAPRSQKFSLYGDIAIHQKCGTEFWQTIRDDLVPQLKAGQFTAALVHAITRMGDLLAQHFPPDGSPSNELPDAVSHD